MSSSVDTPPGAISRSLNEVEAAVEVKEEQAASHRPAPASSNSSKRFMGRVGKPIESGRLPIRSAPLYRIRMTIR
jgi:hypothetical protein